MGARRTLLTLCIAAALVAPAAAQGPSATQQAADLAGQLMSPFCPGRLLVDCTSSQAFDLRDEIARRRHRRCASGPSGESTTAQRGRGNGAHLTGCFRETALDVGRELSQIAVVEVRQRLQAHQRREVWV